MELDAVFSNTRDIRDVVGTGALERSGVESEVPLLVAELSVVLLPTEVIVSDPEPGPHRGFAAAVGPLLLTFSRSA